MKYSYDARKVLQRVWAASGGQCGKYLATSMRTQLDGLQRHGELAFGQNRYSEAVRAELLDPPSGDSSFVAIELGILTSSPATLTVTVPWPVPSTVSVAAEAVPAAGRTIAQTAMTSAIRDAVDIGLLPFRVVVRWPVTGHGTISV